MKEYSEACERNREPILGVLRRTFARVTRVLEIGSGTGQHAAYFAAALPHVVWQTSDLPQHHAGIRAWIAESGAANALPPIVLDVNQQDWHCGTVDAIFTANTLHIMSWTSVQALFRGAERELRNGGVLVIYGPFNYGGRYTAQSNARFDEFLRARDPASGIRDFEAVDALAAAAGFRLLEDVPMPANNRALVWTRPRSVVAGGNFVV